MDKKSAFFIILSIIILIVMLYFIGIDNVIKALKKAYPQANIAAVDYDPGASEVNQLNRIKLMLSTAHKNL